MVDNQKRLPVQLTSSKVIFFALGRHFMFFINRLCFYDLIISWCDSLVFSLRQKIKTHKKFRVKYFYALVRQYFEFEAANEPSILISML